MANLFYCYIEVFGSNFNSEEFSKKINIHGAILERKEKSYPRSPTKALRAGNVNSWRTPKEYFDNYYDKSNPFTKYLYEEKFMINFINKFYNLPSILSCYKNETTETVFVAVYNGIFNEQPSGICFEYDLIEALYKIRASISTEINVAG